MESACSQAKIFQRSLGRQIDYWAKIEELVEKYPGLTFEYLQKLMREGCLQELKDASAPKKQFNAVRLQTSGYRFDREDVNAR